MENRNDIVAYLNDYLAIDKISDKSMNGLQVEGAEEITKVALATDAALVTYEKAAAAGAQMLLVHHGFIWGGLKYITGRNYDHIKSLIDKEMNLYAAHLPLDMHTEVGNNAILANMAGLSRIQPFGEYYGNTVGLSGTLPAPVSVKSLETIFEKELDTEATTLAFGPKEIRTIAIVSGGGASLLEEAIDKQFDCLVTGEGTHDKYHQAKEGNIHLMYLGHYKSETVGVIAVGEKLKKQFPGLETVFIDEPTGY